MTFRLSISAALVALALALSACGGSDKSSSDGDTSSAPATTQATQSTQEPAAPKATAGKGDTDLSHKPKIAKPTGPAPTSLKIEDIVVGKGPAIKAGDNATVHYVGVLYSNGKQFDSSWDRGQPFQFPLGQGMVIPGWDQGVVGMKVGGRRQLTIPSDLAYGPAGTPDGSIPPNAPLIFVIDLKKIG